MQGQEETISPAEGKKKAWLKNTIWGGLSVVLLMVAVGVMVWGYRNLETSEGRVSGVELPWRGSNMSIDGFSATWCPSTGNARMELRAAYYPAVKLTLGNTESSGSIVIRFSDSSGYQRGETLVFPYSDGAFCPRNEVNVKATGKEATAFIESGFADAGEYTVHAISDNTRLWRVFVWNRPSGKYEDEFIGYTCILPAK